MHNSISQYISSHNVQLYHFTDISNIPSIRQNNGLYSWTDCMLRGIRVSRPGSSEQSRNTDRRMGYGGYVRLSFVRNHPMSYVAKKYNRIKVPIDITLDLSILDREGVLFSTMNALDSRTTIGSGIEMAKQLKFHLFHQNYLRLSSWDKKFFQAEVLVPHHVPSSYFLTPIF